MSLLSPQCEVSIWVFFTVMLKEELMSLRNIPSMRWET